jgi:cellulose synthase/poly-beta-1,6-N-acetylglucosamine synthase-like glycosyltransferase
MDYLKKFPKVLISSPTASAKNYCFEEWIDNVLNIKYPNFQVRLFDNTIDDGKNAELLNKIVQDKYGIANPYGKFYAYNSQLLHEVKGENSVIARMARSHNDCRGYAMSNGFDYLLHLESDVFPSNNVIETLMFNKKKVVGAAFYRDEGRNRCLMIQRRIAIAGDYNIKCLNIPANEDLPFLNGSLIEVASVGLGCVLIDVKKVFNKIKFRYIEGNINHPDSYFSEDCFRNKIPIYLNSNIVCRHENRQWGVFGIDYK